jgi:hypothetical protein
MLFKNAVHGLAETSLADDSSRFQPALYFYSSALQAGFLAVIALEKALCIAFIRGVCFTLARLMDQPIPRTPPVAE